MRLSTIQSLTRKYAVFGLLFVVIFTAITGIWLTFFQKHQEIPDVSVKSTVPTSGSSAVGLYPAIEIIFSGDLSLQQQQDITISSTPQITGKPVWKTPHTLTLSSITPLKQNELYILALTGPEITYSWSFRTIAPEKVSLEDQKKVQTQADKEYGDFMKQRAERYPWNVKLPIQTSTYYVYFDTKNEVFRGYLFPSNTLSLEQSKAAATTELRALKIPIEQYPVEWKVNN
jgi:hypothetical protein